MGQANSDNPLDEHERLVARLREPARFPHPVRKVQLIETHISSVLLTGDYAYKLKKPINLGFLDFSTLAKRRECCAEEVRLNRRFAPEIYLGVVPIVGSLDDPHLDGAGEAIEYAVKMREFAQSALLDSMLATGRLRAEHIDALARVIAAFHQRIDRAPAATDYGSARSVALPVLQNFEQIGPYLVTPADRQGLALLMDWTEARLHRLDAVFDQRRRDGFVRECHGDLHLGNIAWIAGEVQAFDGIEFNANLRWIDVLSEAAFLFMDLSERGRPDFAWRFLNGYLEGTGDYRGMGVFNFYLVYRAMVRAKVARMRAAQEHLSAAERAAAMASFTAYLGFAERCTRPPRPLLIISHGLSGSGKSSVTQALLQKMGAVRLRSDVERKRLHGLPADARTRSATLSGIYGADTTERTYQRLFDQARSIIAAGHSAIVDASFLDRRRRDQARRLAAELQVPFLIVHCHASEAELKRRLAAREQAAADPSEANVDILLHQIAAAQPLAADERPFAVALDTAGQNLDTMVAAIEEAMARRGASN